VTCSRRTIYELLLLEWSLVSCVVLTIWSMYQDLIDRNLVLWLQFMSMVEFVLHHCWLVKLSKVDMPVMLSLPGLNRLTVWPVQTQPHSLGMLYKPEVSGPKSPFTNQFKEPGDLCMADKHESCVLMS